MHLKLHFSPGTCARVPLIALEEIGPPFDTELVNFAVGEHKSPAYLAINPKGKVPTLVVDGQPLTENIAILSFLAAAFPRARLLPTGDTPLAAAGALADLAWCASSIHPIVTRIVLPNLFCDQPAGIERVWTLAIGSMHEVFELIEQRLASRPWMLGEWSVVDAYLYWIWDQVAVGGFDGSTYVHYAEHVRRMLARPSVERALSRESAAVRWLEERGFSMQLPPPPGPRL